jgi:capsular exopolysaccharide synthesis family protein
MLPVDPKKTMSDVPVAKSTGDLLLPNGTAPMSLPWVSHPEAGPPAAPAGLSSAPTVGTMLQALRRRWVILLGGGVLGALLVGALVWNLVPGMYTTQVILEFERPLRMEGEWDAVSFKRTQATLLRSDPVLQSALNRPEVRELAEVRSHPDVTGWLEKSLVTDELLGPAILRVTLSGDYPEDLPIVLQQITAAYLKKFAEHEKAKMEGRKSQLEEYYRECARELRIFRLKLHKKQKELGLDDLEKLALRAQIAAQELADLRAQRGNVERELQKQELELAPQQSSLQSPDSLEISEYAIAAEMALDPVVKYQLEGLAKVEMLLQQTEAISAKGAAAANLAVPRAQKKIILKRLAALQKELRPAVIGRIKQKQLYELRQNVSKLDNQISVLKKQKVALDTQIKTRALELDRLQLTARDPGRLPASLLELKDTVDQKELERRRIGEELGAMRFGSASPRVVVRESARAPDSKDAKRQLKFAGLAGVAVFGLVFFGVVCLESRNRRVYGARDVVQGLGINLVGTLPALPAHTRRPLPAAPGSRDVYWQNIMTESVDVIRTVLLHSAQADSLRVVMVTSAVGGEGKTSLASHLAASLARAWRKTLLIDCDLRNPAAHVQFDLPLEPGFSEVLRGEVEWNDVVRPTPGSRLWMIPAGKWDSHAIQALAQASVRGLFERLKEQYDFIIIDACPVLPVADSLLIGQHADAVLFSILRDVSRMPAVFSAHQRLSALGIRMLGAVVIGEKAPSYGPNYPRLTQTPG